MSNIFFVSDTHFNHKKLCYGEEIHFDVPRKYECVSEMNEDIIRQWNNTVTNDDTVIFLGDFLMGTPIKETYTTFWNFYDQLNKGNFIWIIGNHDYILKKKLGNKIEMKYNLKFEYNDIVYTLQHEDYIEKTELLDTLNFEQKNVLIHGHTHAPEKLSTLSYKGMTLQQNNVCWDAWYRPVHINELVSV